MGIDRMADYWQTRYFNALSKGEGATSPRARSAYMDLAEHYKAMWRLSERQPCRIS
jgi:hypothetical protein